MNPENTSSLRKRLLQPNREPTVSGTEGEIGLVESASVGFSSEDHEHPIEHLFDGQSGPGGTFWRSARIDATETLQIEFDHPRSISRLVYEVEERDVERTQEVRIEVSHDGGHSYRQLRVQEYTFSPRGTTFQHEDMQLDVGGVSHLRLTIVPGKSGSGSATLTSLRLFS
jgi:hypothetical protein